MLEWLNNYILSVMPKIASLESQDFVYFEEIVKAFGVDKSNVQRYAKAKGFNLFKVRKNSPGKGGRQLVLAISKEDAEDLLGVRQSEGFKLVDSGKNDDNLISVSPGKGVFYLVQLVPDLKETRVKLGFTGSIKKRMATYYTSNPTSNLVKSWRCLETWEACAMASVTRTGCQKIGPEVFDCENLEALVDRIDGFFEIMPAL